MAGFDNGVVLANNVDFTGANVSSGSAQVTADGQLLIGSAVAPQIRVGNLTSTGATITITNGPGTINLEAASGATRYPITRYVVGPLGDAGYQTIQSALDAATGAGGGAVYIMPSSTPYTENLTLYGDVTLVGATGNSDVASNGGSVTIIGVHTPPLTGFTSFNNLFLQSATDILSSVAAGSATLVMENCNVDCTNGFKFNLPNWTGPLATFHNVDASTNNGVVNNSGGSLIFFQNGFVGAGTGQTMVTSGVVYLQNMQVNCPWNAAAGSQIVAHYSHFENMVTFSGNATGSLHFCHFLGGGGTAAITMNGVSTIGISNSIIESSNNPAVAGVGGGLFNLYNVTYFDSSTYSGIVAAQNLGLVDLGDIRSNFTDHGVLLGHGSRNTLTATAAGTDGQVLIAGTMLDPAFATLTSGDSSITFTPGANSLALAVAGGSTVGKTITGQSGGALSPTTGNWNISGATAAAGTTPVVTSGAVSTLTVNVQISQALAATDATKIGLSNFDSGDFTVDANGFVSLAGGGAAQTITGDSGGALSPTLGNWNLLGRSGSKTSGSVSTLTIHSPPYADQGGSTTVTLNSGSFATAAITLTTPATAGLATGDLLEFVATNGVLVIQLAATQVAHLGSTATTAAGTLTSTATGDSISLRFQESTNDWWATSSIGSWVLA